MLVAATDADLPFLGTLYASTRNDELAAVPWPEPAKAAFLASQFALQHRHLLSHHPTGDYAIVLLREQRIGRLYVDRTPSMWRLVDIALLPAAQGRRIGTALVRWLQAEATTAAADLDLHVAHDNHRAARLYERLGFVRAIGGHATHSRLTWRRGAGTGFS